MCATNGHLFSSPLFLDDSVPFAEGKDLIIDVTLEARGTADIYIDDTIYLTVDIKESNNIRQLK